MNTLRFKLRSNIKKFRKLKKITQENLAEKTGIDYKYIQKIEGKNPPNIQINTLEKISAVLCVPPSKLIK